MWRKSLRNPHGTVLDCQRHHLVIACEPLTILQPVALSGVANDFAILVMLDSLNAAIQVELVPLSRSDSGSVRVQTEALNNARLSMVAVTR